MWMTLYYLFREKEGFWFLISLFNIVHRCLHCYRRTALLYMCHSSVALFLKRGHEGRSPSSFLVELRWREGRGSRLSEGDHTERATALLCSSSFQSDFTAVWCVIIIFLLEVISCFFSSSVMCCLYDAFGSLTPSLSVHIILYCLVIVTENSAFRKWILFHGQWDQTEKKALWTKSTFQPVLHQNLLYKIQGCRADLKAFIISMSKLNISVCSFTWNWINGKQTVHKLLGWERRSEIG